MAVLSKHGEIGQIERVAYKVAYCLDGQVLRNDGDGWKVFKKIKEGLDPRQCFENAKAAYAEKIATKPAFAAWRSLFHETVPFRHRNLMLTCISMMPQDPDGVWSEVNDYSSLHGEGESYSFDDIIQLCRAYQAAVEVESKPEGETATAATGN